MATYKRRDVIASMLDSGIVGVFYHADAEMALKTLQAAYDGGMRVFEWTNRGDRAHEVCSLLLQYADQHLPGMVVGVGSVMDAGTAALYLQLGVNFVVSPILNEETARVCNRRKVLWIPGCGSLTEISNAESYGAEFVKIFPGSAVGGPGFVKAIKGPCPWTEIMPTGGVAPTEENLRAWIEAGVSVVGMGSKLFDKKAIDAQDFDALRSKINTAILRFHTIKKKALQ